MAGTEYATQTTFFYGQKGVALFFMRNLLLLGPSRNPEFLCYPPRHIGETLSGFVSRKNEGKTKRTPSTNHSSTATHGHLDSLPVCDTPLSPFGDIFESIDWRLLEGDGSTHSEVDHFLSFLGEDIGMNE